MKNDNEKRTIYIKSGDTAESISSAIFEKVNQGYGTMYINVNGKEEFTLLSPVRIQPDEKKLDLLGWNEEQFKIDIKTAASIVFQKLTEKTMDFSKMTFKDCRVEQKKIKRQDIERD